MKGLNGKRVLITGGAGGIGTATAIRFIEEGARVVIFDIDENAIQKIEKKLPSLVKCIRADVTSQSSLDSEHATLLRSKTSSCLNLIPS
jgi:2-hydroxycyclohexanecarboxyl-CoA dehydrogenase